MREKNPLQFMYLRMPAFLTLVLITACTTTPGAPNDEIRKSLLGKSKADILSCAGIPVQENQTTQGLVLRYYKEAPMFEESFSFSKGSRSGVHHGCWAHLLMGEDRVVGVEYRSVPISVDATDHCEEIFRACVQ